MAEKKEGFFKRLFRFGKKSSPETEKAALPDETALRQEEEVKQAAALAEQKAQEEAAETTRRAAEAAAKDEARRLAEEQKEKQALEAAQRKAEEEKATAEAEAAERAAEEEAAEAERIEKEARDAAQRKADEEKQRAEDEARKLAEEEEERKRESARLKAEEEEAAEKVEAAERASEAAAEAERLEKEARVAAQKKVDEEKQREEDEARKLAEEEEERKRESARLKAEEEEAAAKAETAESAAEEKRRAAEAAAEAARLEEEARVAAEKKAAEEEARRLAEQEEEQARESARLKAEQEQAALEKAEEAARQQAAAQADLAEQIEQEAQVVKPDDPPAPEPAPAGNNKSWFARLKDGLSRSSSQLSENITAVFTKRKLDEDTLQELEDILIQADLGVETAMNVTDALASQRMGKDVTDEEVREFMAGEIEKVLDPVAAELELNLEHTPHVILVVGVNGSGKTTTIGKLSQKLFDGGFSTLLVAGDTFRAAAIEQLNIWGERTHSPVLSRPLGADAAGLAFDAYAQAVEQGHDVMLMDTAGRLQNKTELMDELEKIIRVLKKQDPTAPHTVLLTLDATTGQNALNQVEIFKDIAGVNGLVMTKLDGTARGGIMVAIASKFKMPVFFIGVGEQVDDLEPFEAREFARSIAGLDV